MTEHPGEQFPPDVDPDVEPGFEPSEEPPAHPDYDTEPGPQNRTYAEQSPERPYDAEAEVDTEAAFEASLDQPAADAELHEPADADLDQPADADLDEPAELDGPAKAEPAKVEPADAEAVDEPTHVDPAEVEFGPEFARSPGQEHEHSFVAESAEDPAPEEQGHPLVEETMGRLDELRDRPVSEHAEVYADLHERLQSALVEADAEQGDRG